VSTAFRRWHRRLELVEERPAPPAEPDMASVHVYDWGNELAARSCVQLGLGLPARACADLMRAGLPISLLCDEPQAEAMAAFIAANGGRVQVTPEAGFAARLLARMVDRG
jgi:hypothetical protein